MANRVETGLQITGLSGDTNALYVIGNSLINGDVDITGNVNVIGTATTLNTETVQTRDNRILLNYSGTSLSAIGGGIEVLSAKTDGSNTSLTTDINSDWNMNVGLNITGRTNDSSSYGLKVKNSGGTDNMVIRNDGNVGIGITSPTAKLHLVGSTNTSSSNSLYISDSASTATFILRDDGGLIVGKNANTTLGNSNSLTIGSQSLATGTNSVAVGHLASASGTESTSFGKQTISSNDGTTSIGSNSTASGQQSVAIGRVSTASSTESIAIGRLNTSSNTGAITIGSQSQSTGTRSEVIGSFSFSKSDYSTSIGSFININTGLTGANVIGYGLTAGGGQELSATTSNSLALGWNSTTPSFLFSKSSDSYLNGSGNVGIGTTTPSEKLEVNGNIMLSPLGTATSASTYYDSNILKFNLSQYSGSEFKKSWKVQAKANSGDQYETYLQFIRSSDNIPNMYLTNSALILGNTANPLTNTNTPGGYGINFRIVDRFEILNYGGVNTAFQFGTSGNTSLLYDALSGGILQFNSNSSVRFRNLNTSIPLMSIDNTDGGGAIKVGIGTVSPTSNVDIKGYDSTSSNYSLKVKNSSDVEYLSVRNDGKIEMGPMGNAKSLTIDENGNVSIGAGNGRTITLGSTNLNTVNSFVMSYASGIAGVNLSTLDFHRSSKVAGYPVRFNTIDLIGNGLSQYDFPMITFEEKPPLAFTQPVFSGSIYNETGSWMSFSDGKIGVRNTESAFLNSNLYTNNLRLRSGLSTGSAGGGYITFETCPPGPTGTSQNSEVERVRITNTGEVGIATSSPTAKLDVSGSTGYNQLRMRTSFTPSSSGDTSGNIGDVAWDDTYYYMKTNTGWGRIVWDYGF